MKIFQKILPRDGFLDFQKTHFTVEKNLSRANPSPAQTSRSRPSHAPVLGSGRDQAYSMCLTRVQAGHIMDFGGALVVQSKYWSRVSARCATAV